MESLKKNQILVQELNVVISERKKMSLDGLNSILDVIEEFAYIAHRSISWYTLQNFGSVL